MNRRRTGTLVVWLAVALAVLVGRAQRPGPLTGEERTTLRSAVDASAPEQFPTSTPATRAEVDAALMRAFAGGVETAVPDPQTAVADFNGDGSPDLAVVVRRTEARAFEVNDELRNWSVQDLAPETGRGPVAPGKVEEGERLLAVVHGYGPAGFRNPEARQAYLLKHAAGSRLSVVRKEEIVDLPAKGPMPKGDLLSEDVGGVARVLYWTGARYAFRR